MANGIPVRLSAHLTAVARIEAEFQDRSLTEQVEHWARLGQAVEQAVAAATVARLKRRSHDPLMAQRLAFADTAEGRAKAAALIRKRNAVRYEVVGNQGVSRAAEPTKRKR